MANSRKAKRVRCIENGVVYNSCREAGRALGINISLINKVVSGKQESTKGLHFEVVEENAQEVGIIPPTVQNEQGELIPVLDSREVARLMGIPHRYVLEYIEGKECSGTIGIAMVAAKCGKCIGDYFIPSTYLFNNKECKCYLVTKQGCELLGNKQQGEKGILFSLAYVERFNEMEGELKEKQQPKQMSDDEIIAKALFLLNGKYEQAIAELKQTTVELTEKTEFIDDINDCFTFTQISQFNKQLLKDRKDIVLSTSTLNKVAAELCIPINKIDNPIEYSPYKRVNAYPRKVWEKAYPDIKLPEKENK